MEQYIIKDGKQLRLGYTTGSCAAAASKAAAWMLLTGKRKESVSLQTPKGIALELAVQEISMMPDSVSCAIEKDSGDDPDVTKGALIFADVRKSEIPGVRIDGGFGVGRVTKPGLDQPVGNAAINSVPRRMIAENVQEVMSILDYHGGIEVIIRVPLGEELAKKTFNPRLGIVGGISILGTTGIVEPMSEEALIETIHVELKQKRVNGAEYVLLTPGNYGSEFIRDSLGLDPKIAVQSSNFIGDTIDYCKELGFKGALLIGHIGKLIKIGGNMLNTHSKYGDCRMPIMAACAGAEGLRPERISQILECVSCDDGLKILTEEGLVEPVMKRLVSMIHYNLQYRAGAELEIGCATFSKEYGMLGKSDNAELLSDRILGRDITLQVMTRELCHELFRSWENDISLCRDASEFQPYIYSEDAVNAYFDAKQAPDRVVLAVMRERKAIGELQLKRIDAEKKECTMSIHLQNDSVKGKGYGIRAVQLGAKYAFDRLGMHTVNADALSANLRSRHVLEKAGFCPVREGGDFVYYRLEASACSNGENNNINSD